MKKLLLCLTLATSALAYAMQDGSKIAWWVFSAKLSNQITQQKIIDDIDTAYGGSAPLSITPIEKVAWLRLKDTRESILKKLHPYTWFNEKSLFCDSTSPKTPSLNIRDY